MGLWLLLARACCAVALIQAGRMCLRPMKAGKWRRRPEVFRLRLHESQLGRGDRRAGWARQRLQHRRRRSRQPTHFLPRRNRFIFRVPGACRFQDKDELIWTLTTQGKTEKAFASLRLDYQIDDVVRASETGALGAGSSSPEIRANKPPAVEVQGRKSLDREGRRSGELTAVVTDDGIPKRRGAGLAGAAVATPARAMSRRNARQSRDAAARARHRRQERRPAPVVVRLSRQGRRDVLARADHVVGRHARRRQFTVGAGVGPAAHAGRRQSTVWATFSSPAPTSCARAPTMAR